MNLELRLFSEGDELGFFMPEESEPVKWTLTEGQWISASPLSWKDKVNKFTYCAYYPFSTESTTRDNIPMPDLSLQNGTLAGIGEFDFLTARCEASYEKRIMEPFRLRVNRLSDMHTALFL